MAELSIIEKIVSSQFVWAILCIIVVVVLYKAVVSYVKELKAENVKREDNLLDLYEKQKEESVAREERLMAHVEKTTETLSHINDNLEHLEEEMARVHRRIDGIDTKLEKGAV